MFTTGLRLAIGGVATGIALIISIAATTNVLYIFFVVPLVLAFALLAGVLAFDRDGDRGSSPTQITPPTRPSLVPPAAACAVLAMALGVVFDRFLLIAGAIALVILAAVWALGIESTEAPEPAVSVSAFVSSAALERWVGWIRTIFVAATIVGAVLVLSGLAKNSLLALLGFFLLVAVVMGNSLLLLSDATSADD